MEQSLSKLLIMYEVTDTAYHNMPIDIKNKIYSKHVL